MRCYRIIATAVAIAGYYLPTLPVALWMPLAAMILGVGSEVVRASVTPSVNLDNVNEFVAELDR